MQTATLSPTDNAIPVFARWIGSWGISVQRRPYEAGPLSRLYDRSAPGWNRILSRLGMDRAYESMLAREMAHIKTAPLYTECRVLDCGVGTGAFSMALSRVSPLPVTIEGIDISERMLEIAANRFDEAGVRAELRQSDIRDLPYENEQFDVVMGAHVLEHLADPATALKEMARVLKPGGKLITCITRQSLLGLFVQLKWRTHRISLEQAENWLAAANLEDTHSVSLSDRYFSGNLSIACIGTKPIR